MQFVLGEKTFARLTRREATFGIAGLVLKSLFRSTEQLLLYLDGDGPGAGGLVTRTTGGASCSPVSRTFLLRVSLQTATLPTRALIGSSLSSSPSAGDAFPAGSSPFLSAYPGPSPLTSDPSYRSANPSTHPMAHLWASHAHEGNSFKII